MKYTNVKTSFVHFVTRNRRDYFKNKESLLANIY